MIRSDLMRFSSSVRVTKHSSSNRTVPLVQRKKGSLFPLLFIRSLDKGSQEWRTNGVIYHCNLIGFTPPRTKDKSALELTKNCAFDILRVKKKRRLKINKNRCKVSAFAKS